MQHYKAHAAELPELHARAFGFIPFKKSCLWQVMEIVILVLGRDTKLPPPLLPKTLLPICSVIRTKFLQLLGMYSGEEFLLRKNPIREKFMISWKYIYPCP